MKPNKSPLTIGKLVAGLKRLPEKALMRKSTWERFIAASDKRGPKVRQSFSPGQVSDLHGMTTWTMDEAYERGEQFRISGYGLISEDEETSKRNWLIPLTVWEDAGGGPSDTNYRPRAAELDGTVITHQAVMETEIDELPALVGWRTPEGDWADGSNPQWRAAKESDPGGDYPAPVSAPGWELLTFLAAAPLQFPQPLFYIARY